MCLHQVTTRGVDANDRPLRQSTGTTGVLGLGYSEVLTGYSMVLVRPRAYLESARTVGTYSGVLTGYSAVIARSATACVLGER